MKRYVMTVLTACICALLFCSCSVKSKGSLISYAKSEFGDCKFVSQEVTGSGNDTVRTVYLIDEDTGIEYTVTSSMVDMNIDGMPWFIRRKYNKQVEQDNPDSSLNLSKEQMRIYRVGALKAGLLIVGVFGGAYLLFTLFCYFVWFR